MKWILLCLLSYAYVVYFDDLVYFTSLSVSSVRDILTGKIINFSSIFIVGLMALKFNLLKNILSCIFIASVYLTSLVMDQHVSSFLSAVIIVNIVSVSVVLVVALLSYYFKTTKNYQDK